MSVSLRAAVTDDLQAVHALHRQLYDDLHPLLDERVEQAWLDTLATPGRTVLLAVTGAAVVGTVDLTVVVNAARGGRSHLLVEDVVVDTAHRGSGIGRTMLSAAFEHARAAGCCKVQLSAVEPDASAFHEAVGRAVPGRTYELYLAD